MRWRILALVCLLLPLSALAQTYTLAPVAHQQFLDSNGRPLASGRLYTYLAGTTTPAATYTTSTGTLNTNPIVLDAGGYTPNGFYLDPAVQYKFRVTNALGVQMWQQDNVSAAGGAAGGAFDPHSPPTIGDVAPNTLDCTVCTAHTRFQGPLVGNVTGNLTGNVVGNVTGNLTGNASGSAASVPLSGVTAMTAPSSIDSSGNALVWNWELSGGSPVVGFSVGEGSPSTNTAGYSSLMTVTTRGGSTINPFQALAAGINGLRVNSAGNILALGSANFVGNIVGNATTATTATNFTGFQAGHFGPTCVTTSTTFAICTTTYNFSSATPTSLPGYADANYTFTCTLTGSPTSLPVLYAVNSVSGSQFSVQIILANGTTPASAPGINCTFYHP